MKQLLFSFLFITTTSVFSQWNVSSTINTSVAIAAKSQNNVHSVTDTKWGAIISWDDNRNSPANSTDIYAQRMSNMGLPKWSVNGLAVCNNASTQQSSAIIDAGNGSAIITWEDFRAGNYDIYAQKIDSSGNVLWTANGVAVCSKTNHQKNPKITADNNGGAIIVWEDSVNNFWDIYAQRINASGVIVWTTNGVAICNVPNAQINPKIDSDDAGGAILTWQDKRNNTDYDIYAQRIDGNGLVLWPANGVAVSTAINTQSNPRIEPDGNNGALIGWIDKRNAIDYNIYAQHISDIGIAQWTSNGILICGAANNQSALDMKYLGASGTAFTWKDSRTNTLSVYAQMISENGAIGSTTDGILLSNALKSNNPNIIRDDNGGAIIAWQDSTVLGWDIKTQKISPGGIQWQAGGVMVSNAVNDQVNVSQVKDGNGGAIYIWEDYRNANDYNLYAHHLFYNGSEVVGLNERSGTNLVQVHCFPNPVSPGSVIQLKNNVPGKQWQISIYDSFGKLLNEQTLKSDEAFQINANNKAGVYFYIVKIENEFAKGSFIVTD
ncbi:MAG: T9SS type A sorting domain-containing protein [Bacteroidetes bacterium]|nr:T9SS type A sorting domain-containing protein [Bacteroidota bacterium]